MINPPLDINSQESSISSFSLFEPPFEAQNAADIISLPTPAQMLAIQDGAALALDATDSIGTNLQTVDEAIRSSSPSTLAEVEQALQVMLDIVRMEKNILANVGNTDLQFLPGNGNTAASNQTSTSLNTTSNGNNQNSNPLMEAGNQSIEGFATLDSVFNDFDLQLQQQIQLYQNISAIMNEVRQLISSVGRMVTSLFNSLKELLGSAGLIPPGNNDLPALPQPPGLPQQPGTGLLPPDVVPPVDLDPPVTPPDVVPPVDLDPPVTPPDVVPPVDLNPPVTTPDVVPPVDLDPPVTPPDVVPPVDLDPPVTPPDVVPPVDLDPPVTPPDVVPPVDLDPPVAPPDVVTPVDLNPPVTPPDVVPPVDLALQDDPATVAKSIVETALDTPAQPAPTATPPDSVTPVDLDPPVDTVIDYPLQDPDVVDVPLEVLEPIVDWSVPQPFPEWSDLRSFQLTDAASGYKNLTESASKKFQNDTPIIALPNYGLERFYNPALYQRYQENRKTQGPPIHSAVSEIWSSIGADYSKIVPAKDFRYPELTFANMETGVQDYAAGGYVQGTIGDFAAFEVWRNVEDQYEDDQDLRTDQLNFRNTENLISLAQVQSDLLNGYFDSNEPPALRDDFYSSVITRPVETQLADWILEQPGQISTKELIAKSVELAGGDRYLGILSLSNFTQNLAHSSEFEATDHYPGNIYSAARADQISSKMERFDRIKYPDGSYSQPALSNTDALKTASAFYNGALVEATFPYPLSSGSVAGSHSREGLEQRENGDAILQLGLSQLEKMKSNPFLAGAYNGGARTARSGIIDRHHYSTTGATGYEILDGRDSVESLVNSTMETKAEFEQMMANVDPKASSFSSYLTNLATNELIFRQLKQLGEPGTSGEYLYRTQGSQFCDDPLSGEKTPMEFQVAGWWEDFQKLPKEVEKGAAELKRRLDQLKQGAVPDLTPETFKALMTKAKQWAQTTASRNGLEILSVEEGSPPITGAVAGYTKVGNGLNIVIDRKAFEAARETNNRNGEPVDAPQVMLNAVLDELAGAYLEAKSPGVSTRETLAAVLAVGWMENHYGRNLNIGVVNTAKRRLEKHIDSAGFWNSYNNGEVYEAIKVLPKWAKDIINKKAAERGIAPL